MGSRNNSFQTKRKLRFKIPGFPNKPRVAFFDDWKFLSRNFIQS